MDCAIIVPARLESQRFPRKLLHPIQGQPLILWTAQRIQKEAPEFPLFFAVDGSELQKVLEENGYATVLTPPQLPSGTDRIALANRTVNASRIINVQADEPLVARSQIQALAQGCTQAPMATMACPFPNKDDFFNPNRVKVITDHNGNALYFSRSPIPYHRDKPDVLPSPTPLLHLGLYSYQNDFLAKFSSLPQGNLERIEKLEQLRALENGFNIQVSLTQHPNIGIDTPRDIKSFEAALPSIS